VEGRIPAGSRDQVFYRKVDDPPAYFGATLKRLLELRGVKVSGQVRRGVVPADARLLTVAESEALGEIVRRLEKTSNNFIAEQLLKTLGAEKKGAPGSWPKGIQAVEDFLAEVGIPRGSYVMRNGSGLNDTNRFSARQTVTLLRDVWRRFPVVADFVAALPVAGKDGTTRWRMEATEGRVRAKTGTLEGVTALSGFVETAARDRLVFSILVNDYAGRAHLTVRAVDAVGSALAAAGRPADLGAAVASAVPPPSQAEEATATVKAHLATYYRLGRAGDPRNVEFLRASLKEERDPVLRMAAAEAVYLSDPESGSARRAFLDAVAAEGGSLPRLRALAGDDEEGAPVLSSLAELASQGRTDAVARLVELSPAAMGDPALAPRFAQLWDEVARGAPAEVAAVLERAPAAGGDAALAAVGRAVASSPEPEHPLVTALQQQARDPDPDVAACARALSPRLERAVAAARAVLQAGPAPTIGPQRAGEARKEPASQGGG
jgi:serine-type D-Ala-D-Ala carboxypeptidase/endopeptidase (penicillin-binding protein 4)